MSATGDVLRRAREDAGLSQTKAAEMIRKRLRGDFTRAALSQIECGLTKNPKPANLQAACEVYRIDINEAIQGKLVKIKEKQSVTYSIPHGLDDLDVFKIKEQNFELPDLKLPELFNRLPVVGTAQLGTDGYWVETEYPVGRGEGYVEFVSRDPNAYVLRVRGESMAPAIRSGWLVVVEPNSVPAPGSYVMVCTTDGRCMVKEFLYQRNGEIALASVNESFARITLEGVDIAKMHPVGAIIPSHKFKPW